MNEIKNEVKKSVAVMMPFGGAIKTRRRRLILEFFRLKYNIEEGIKVVPSWGSIDDFLMLEVRVFETRAGAISPQALQKISEADYLIGFVDEKNVNVTYELTVGILLKFVPILICKGKVGDILPIYLQDLAHIDYEKVTNESLKKSIKGIADLDDLHLDFHLDQIPDPLKLAVDKHDDPYRAELQAAFQKIETKPPPSPQEFVLNLVRDLDPGRVLHPWQTYYRYAVLRQRWRKQSEHSLYKPEDADGPLIVYDASNKFFELFNLDMNRDHFPDPDGETPLEIAYLVKKLSDLNCIDKSDLDAFMKDQVKLTEAIIFGGQRDKAKVPMRFNNNHLENYSNRDFLPALVGKRVVGDVRKPHSTFYLIIYLRVDDLLRSLEQTEGMSGETDH